MFHFGFLVSFYDMRFRFFFFSAYCCPVVPAPLLLKSYFSFMELLLYLFQKPLGYICLWLYFQVLYSIPLIYMSFSPPVPHSLDHHSYKIKLNIRKTNSPIFILFCKDIFYLVFQGLCFSI